MFTSIRKIYEEERTDDDVWRALQFSYTPMADWKRYCELRQIYSVIVAYNMMMTEKDCYTRMQDGMQ